MIGSILALLTATIGALLAGLVSAYIPERASLISAGLGMTLGGLLSLALIALGIT